MSKLTLSVEYAVVARAKRYAKLRGVSVSKMVEAYLTTVAGPSFASSAPVLQSLRGSLNKADIHDYKKHLTAKYR